MIARIPLVLDPQPEGGYTVTSPLLPELITEGDTVEECLANAEDAFSAVVDLYEYMERSLPPGIYVDAGGGPVISRCRRLRSVRYREAARKLGKLGCYEVFERRRGSHRRWFNPRRPGDWRLNAGLGQA